ncbi:MAG TPA: UDP-glucose/GDP-mannose dehydrogenase family protein [Ilumatobacter sp.]|nr:UDP-glucose/GDP-mannose dehydrogenase family protein [Ilumatobacter sp.]
MSHVLDQPAQQRIAVVGTGYVGLTTGACFAHVGFDVVCADIDADKVARLQGGEIPIVEDGLAEIVADAVAAGRLTFVVGAATAAADADIIFLCVPTPQDDDGSADLSYVQAAAAEIAPVLRPGAVVVNKSTVPVGSTLVVERVMQRPDVSVVSNPEFLREGTAVHDFLHPDRVVIGGDRPEAAQDVARLYAGFDTDIILTDAASAETIKYAANGFLAMKISFVNAVAAMCEAVGADVEAVVAGIGSDRRIGPAFLKPGPGWGGSCFPKDTRALVSIAAQHGYDFSMMRGVVSVNDEQLERMVRKVANAAGRTVSGYRPLDGVRVGALGLTFKAGTDDLRESPSLTIIRRLAALGADVHGYDPTVALELSTVQEARLVDVSVYDSPIAALTDVDVAVVLTEWPEFASLDLVKARAVMRGGAIVDTRNLLNPVDVRAAGFSYDSVGRP